jgi:hypothetical protein
MTYEKQISELVKIFLLKIAGLVDIYFSGAQNSFT